MKLGITGVSYTRYGISEGARKAHENGYSCFDFGRFSETDTDFFKQSEADLTAELIRYRKLVEAEGIEVWQSHSPWRHPARDFTVEDRAERLDCFLKAIRGSGVLGVTNFVVHAIMPYGTNSPEYPDSMKEMNAEFMGRLAEEAKKCGVKHICFENLPFPALPINHTYQCLEFAKRMNKEINTDIFKVCLDTGHANFCGENPADSVRLIGKEYLGALHVHDNNGLADQHERPGNGNIDWVDFSNALEEIGFDGCLSFETRIPGGITDQAEMDRLDRELAESGKRIAKLI